MTFTLLNVSSTRSLPIQNVYLVYMHSKLHLLKLWMAWENRACVLWPPAAWLSPLQPPPWQLNLINDRCEILIATSITPADLKEAEHCLLGWESVKSCIKYCIFWKINPNAEISIYFSISGIVNINQWNTFNITIWQIEFDFPHRHSVFNSFCFPRGWYSACGKCPI